MCKLVIEIFRFPTIVAIKELNQVLEVVSCNKFVKKIHLMSHDIYCDSRHT